jgi:hypothetical protein
MIVPKSPLGTLIYRLRRSLERKRERKEQREKLLEDRATAQYLLSRIASGDDVGRLQKELKDIDEALDQLDR